MFNFKKLAAMVCTIAITATMFVLPVSANGALATVGNGILEPTAAGHTFVTINSNYFKDNYTTSGTLMFKVTKNIFKNVVKVDWSDEEALWNGDAWDKPTIDVQYSTDYSADYDLITVSWAGQNAYKTADGKIAQLRLIYTDSTTKGDAVITPVSYEEDSSVTYDLCDANGNTTAQRQPFVKDTNTYKLASGTNVITPIAPGPTEVIATATEAGEKDATAIGDTYYGDTDTTDTAVAYGVGLMGEENQTYTNVLWTVTANGETKYHKSPVNVSGAATYKIGLVIQGLTKDMVTAVKAVLQ